MTENLSLSLAKLIAGDFSNQKQALAESTKFAHIRLFFRPLPWDFFSGIGFYSEQVYDHDLWTPYRQGVHRFVEKDGQVYIENYALKDRICYAGAGRESSILNTISKDCLERRLNCSMVFSPKGNHHFQGKVEGKCCFIEKYGRKTYLVSDVDLTDTTFITIDRGMDVETNEQVWGSENGPLKFEKRESFASELILH